MGFNDRWGRRKPGLDATEAPSDMDIAWAAGIFEGEGSCWRTGNSQTVSVGQKDTWLPYRLKALFGGSVYLPPARVTTMIPSWHASGGRARDFLHAVYPYLSPRRQAQASAVLGDELVA